MDNPVLVTGGAGYIGSHVVKQLGAIGRPVIVLDNLCKGFREAVIHGQLVVGDSGDRSLVTRLLREHRIDTVLHFAALTVVPESVAEPLKYYANNTCQTRNLLASCDACGVKNFVFSSTAAVYGIPAGPLASEDTPTAPINPYGTSKLMSEWMLRDLAASTGLRYVILRYFNVAGSDPACRIGQSTPGATLLIKVAAEVAAGTRESVAIYGNDYPTPDGTGVRDYVHVEDLADAHLRALEYLQDEGESTTLNCGYQQGYSVREVLTSLQRVHGSPIKIVEKERRAGDPPILVAAASRIKEVLGWQPRYADLDTIVATSLAWEKNRRY